MQLFEKTRRNTTLTRYGEEFLICAEHTLETLDAGVENLQRSARGEGLIRLGFLRPLGVEYVPRLAASYLAEHSDKRIDFTFHTDVTGPLLDGLAAQGFGIAIVPHMDMFHKLDISIIPITAPAYERNFYMVYDERTYMPPVVRDFLEYVIGKAR